MKLYKNGTPYPDAAWKRWYGIKNSHELLMEREEFEKLDAQVEAEIDQAIEDRYHHHGDRK